MRTWMVLVFAVVALQGFVTSHADEQAKEDQTVTERLRQPIAFRFDAHRLIHAIELVGHETGAKIEVDWQGVQATGAGRDTPITLAASGLTAENALRMILLYADGGTNELGYTIVGDSLLISNATTLPTVAEKHLDQMLAKPITVRYEEAKLVDVFADLQEKIGINVVPHWGELGLYRIERSRTVSLSVEDVPVSRVLDLLLDYLHEELRDITWQASDNLIEVGSRERFLRRRSTKLYNVTTLLDAMVAYRSAHSQHRLTPMYDPAAEEPAEEGKGIFAAEPEPEPEPLSRSELVYTLMELIRGAVYPNGWRAAGGLTATMEDLNGQLIVSGSRQVHEGVSQYLAGLNNRLRQHYVIETVALTGDGLELTSRLEALPKNNGLQPAMPLLQMARQLDGVRVAGSSRTSGLGGIARDTEFGTRADTEGKGDANQWMPGFYLSARPSVSDDGRTCDLQYNALVVTAGAGEGRMYRAGFAGSVQVELGKIAVVSVAGEDADQPAIHLAFRVTEKSEVGGKKLKVESRK